jgi:hypothetical protein
MLFLGLLEGSNPNCLSHHSGNDTVITPIIHFVGLPQNRWITIFRAICDPDTNNDPIAQTLGTNERWRHTKDRCESQNSGKNDRFMVDLPFVIKPFLAPSRKLFEHDE